jgi:hypothetical protein
VPDDRSHSTQSNPGTSLSSRQHRRQVEAGIKSEPHGFAEHQAAQDPSNKKKAAVVSKTPRLLEGQRGTITGGIHDGRSAVITKCNFKSLDDERLAAAGTPESRFAECESYVVRTRDGRSDLLEVAPEDFEVLEHDSDFGRSVT